MTHVRSLDFVELVAEFAYCQPQEFVLRPLGPLTRENSFATSEKQTLAATTLEVAVAP